MKLSSRRELWSALTLRAVIREDLCRYLANSWIWISSGTILDFRHWTLDNRRTVSGLISATLQTAPTPEETPDSLNLMARSIALQPEPRGQLARLEHHPTPMPLPDVRNNRHICPHLTATGLHPVLGSARILMLPTVPRRRRMCNDYARIRTTNTSSNTRLE